MRPTVEVAPKVEAMIASSFG
uniref:Uncharacterized protein n=1 Tax=Arundo donax TaxID=35708 RepID=A0A0A9F3C0_ARUDO